MRFVPAFVLLASLGGFPEMVSADEGRPAAPSGIRIDAASTGAPINEFIYAQFIEHLGRCIYGGIWAEMLEDRKFYHPITAEYSPYGPGKDMAENPLLPVVAASPWEMLGADGGVTMARENSFVGEMTPRIGAGGGIRQNDLGLVKGRIYNGYVWLRAKNSGATAKVTLAWGEGPADRQEIPIDPVAVEYTRYPLSFRAGADSEKGSLAIEIAGAPCFVGTASLMPEDNVMGMRADTLALLKQLDAPMYRWPGGNFVSGYDWRDGIGDRDRRPPRRNPAWTGVEHNDFGLDEFIAFCREVRAEPLIAANTGFGDGYSAAQEVEYCNGSAETIAGQWRAGNGHAEPYGVKWWCVGNEMFGPWQLGFMQLKHYTLKHNEVARQMLAADPSIQLIAVGALEKKNPKHDPDEKRGWTRGMFESCAERMDIISEHFYCGDKKDLREHVGQLAAKIREIAEGHRKLRREIPEIEKKDIDIAMDEWNYWHHPYEYGELGCRYTLRDALGVAAGLHEYFRQSDLIAMAHYAQTVNVIGCIKTTKTDAFFATTALPLMLYRHHFGALPVTVEAPDSLDVMAALTGDRKALTIGIVNPGREAVTVPVDIGGVTLAGTGRRWEIAGDDPMRFNEPGRHDAVKIEEKAIREAGNQLSVRPCSVTLFLYDLR